MKVGADFADEYPGGDPAKAEAMARASADARLQDAKSTVAAMLVPCTTYQSKAAGDLQLGARGAGTKTVADAASYAVPEAPATGIGELQLRALSAGGGLCAEAAPEAPVTGIGKLQWGAAVAGGEGFADAGLFALEAPATGMGKMQLETSPARSGSLFFSSGSFFFPLSNL